MSNPERSQGAEMVKRFYGKLSECDWRNLKCIVFIIYCKTLKRFYFYNLDQELKTSLDLIWPKTQYRILMKVLKPMDFQNIFTDNKICFDTLILFFEQCESCDFVKPEEILQTTYLHEVIKEKLVNQEDLHTAKAHDILYHTSQHYACEICDIRGYFALYLHDILLCSWDNITECIKRVEAACNYKCDINNIKDFQNILLALNIRSCAENNDVNNFCWKFKHYTDCPIQVFNSKRNDNSLVNSLTGHPSLTSGICTSEHRTNHEQPCSQRGNTLQFYSQKDDILQKYMYHKYDIIQLLCGTKLEKTFYDREFVIDFQRLDNFTEKICYCGGAKTACDVASLNHKTNLNEFDIIRYLYENSEKIVTKHDVLWTEDLYKVDFYCYCLHIQDRDHEQTNNSEIKEQNTYYALVIGNKTNSCKFGILKNRCQNSKCVKKDNSSIFLYLELGGHFIDFTVGCLVFIGILLLRAGIEPNPGPGNDHDLGQSENYVWKTNEVLGRGATAVVYKARSKQTREMYAVKVFHNRVSSHFSGVPIRELEVLRRLKHKNVIGILCIEQEMRTGNQVLVMELCTGGSLYAMLDQPKYAFGFPEKEYLIVMKDIAEGMKYIRQQDFIHRDIKPGNIMRFIDENGSSVYKLTDFGAARQLDDEESFTSIYGTEEYLDPNMYQRAVLRQHLGQEFDASVDLWSLGVTLFHIATGHLPFQPYGGRSNAGTMYRITTEKEPGIISGIQHQENGPIRWERELPKTCLLSSSLKSLITPVMAGLMENNRDIRWSFDQFFATVNDIVNMTILKIFYSCQGSNLMIYINGKSTFATLQEQIAMETEIPASEQLIIYNHRVLSDIVDATQDVQSYSKSILEGQLYLYNRERVDQQRLTIPEIAPFPNFLTSINIDRDCSVAHRCCSVAFLIERWILTMIESQKMMQQADTFLRDHITQITKRIDNSLPDMYRLLNETNKRQVTFYTSSEQILALYKVLSKTFMQSKNLTTVSGDALVKLSKILSDRSPEDVIKKAENRAEEIKVYMSVLMEKIKEQERESISNCVGCLDNDKCIQKANDLCMKIQEIWNTFKNHRKQRSLSPDDQLNHDSDRDKLTEYCSKLLSILQCHCLQNYQTVYRVVIKQALLLIKNLQRTKKVDVNISSVMECQGKISTRIDKLQEDCVNLNTQYVEILTKQEAVITKMDEHGATPLAAASLSSDPVYNSVVEKISQEFNDLNSGSIELQNMVKQNISKIQETNRFAESWLKELNAIETKQNIQPSIPKNLVAN